MVHERRRFTRIPYNVKAKIEYSGSHVDCDVKDIAFRGLYAGGGEEVPEGSEVMVVIHLTDDSSRAPLSITGNVVRKTERGFGVEFKEMDLDSFTDLKYILIYQSGSEALLMEELMDFIEEV